MKLYEFEGKSLFERSGIAVPRGRIVYTPDEAKAAFREFGKVFVKAQVLWGGRGKQKAVLQCDTEQQVEEACSSLFGRQLRDETVEQLLVEEKLDIAHEYYLSVTYQGRTPAVIASAAGGMDIEEARRTNPERVVVQPVDILKGLDAQTAEDILKKAGFESDTPAASQVLLKLYNMFIEDDANLAEINPLVKTADGKWYAADAKVDIDDDAMYRLRHLNLPERLASGRKPTHLEALAIRNDQTDTRGASGRMFFEVPGGNIVILASGGGTSVEALDALCLLGGKPSIFTEYSGNPTGEKVRALTRIALMTEQPVDCIWVIGGRANFTDIYETLVNGVMAGIRETEGFDKTIPIIIRRAGPRDAEAFDTLHKARTDEGYNIFVRGMATTVTDSAHMVVHHARKHEALRSKRQQ